MEQQLDRLEKLPLEFEAQSLQLKQEHDALVNQLGVRGFHITRTPTQGMESEHTFPVLFMCYSNCSVSFYACDADNPGGELIPYLTKDQMVSALSYYSTTNDIQSLSQPPPKLPGPRAFKVLPSPLGGQEFVSSVSVPSSVPISSHRLFKCTNIFSSSLQGTYPTNHMCTGRTTGKYTYNG